MLHQIFTSVGRMFSFLISLIVAVVMGVITWAFWGLYQDARVQSQFIKEGRLLSVQVDRADQHQRSWQDILSHSTYLTLTYHGKTYTTRFVMDSAYVGSGDRVQLLYHPNYDAFRQRGNGVHFDQSRRKSRLIQWGIVRDFSDENQLLFMCLLLSSAAFFLISGVIVSIIPIPLLQDIARFIFVIEMLLASIFFTYNAWRYINYYQHIKSNGRQVDVRMLDTQRTAYGKMSETTLNWYDYEATIRYQQQEKIIPISRGDFETLKPNDSLRAYYDESVNDFMAVDYPPDYTRIFSPLCFWLITFLLIRPAFTGRNPESS